MDNNLTDRRDEESYGPVIGIVIVVALIFFGGWFYILGRDASQGTIVNPNEEGWEVVEGGEGQEFLSTTSDQVIPEDFNVDQELEGLNLELRS